MRKRIVAGNWKMNMLLEEGYSLASEIVNMLADEYHGSTQVIIFPPYLHLPGVSKLAASRVKTGAQDVSRHDKGAFTGEVSAAMVKSAGAQYTLVGHSERRQFHGESDEVVAAKMKMAWAAGLDVVLCVGELLAERKAGRAESVVKQQLERSLEGVGEEFAHRLVVAYEPVWAIGTGVTASATEAQEMHAYIRTVLGNIFNSAIANVTTILYGGSCNAKNAAELFSQPDIDGGLIGGASLKSRDFVDIIKSVPA